MMKQEFIEIDVKFIHFNIENDIIVTSPNNDPDVEGIGNGGTFEEE